MGTCEEHAIISTVSNQFAFFCPLRLVAHSKICVISEPERASERAGGQARLLASNSCVALSITELCGGPQGSFQATGGPRTTPSPSVAEEFGQKKGSDPQYVIARRVF